MNKKIQYRSLILLIASLSILANLIIIPSFIINTYLFTYHYKLNSIEKDEKAMSLSKNHQNLVYLMIDMTNGFDISSILKSDLSLQKSFSGFTDYTNVITSNYGTNSSFPNLIGGYDFNPYYKKYGSQKGFTFRQYLQNAYKRFLTPFAIDNWDISLAGDIYYDYNDKLSYWNGNYHSFEKDFQQFHAQAINANDQALYLSKKNPEAYKKLKLPWYAYRRDDNYNDVAALELLSNLTINDTNRSKILEINNESVHNPICMDQHGTYKTNTYNSYNVYLATIGFIMKIKNFINYLKLNNVYDNTMIVIVSDHGTQVGSQAIFDVNKNTCKFNFEDIKWIKEKYAPNFYRHFPALLVKPYNCKGNLKFNNKDLFSNTDALSFIETYNKSLDFEAYNKIDDCRYLKNVNKVNERTSYLPSYGADTLWNDQFTEYFLSEGKYSSESFKVIKNIFKKNNYLINIDKKDYYDIDNKSFWKKL